MNPGVNQTDPNGDPAEKTSTMHMKRKLGFTRQLMGTVEVSTDGLTLKDAVGPNVQLPNFPLSEQAKALMMPPINSSSVTSHAGKRKGQGPNMTKGPGPSPVASGTGPLRRHCPSSGTRPRSPEPFARAAKGEGSSLTLHSCWCGGVRAFPGLRGPHCGVISCQPKRP